MKHLILIGTLFLFLSSCFQTKDSEIESILHDCLIRSYKEQEVNISKELDELENYLIENKFLKSSSGQAYYDFYKEIVHLNDVPATIDYDQFAGIYELTPNEFYQLECLEKLKKIDSTTLAQSKYHQLTLAIQEASSDGMTPSKIAKAITEVLNPSDFHHPYYRNIALLSIAYTSNSDKGLAAHLKPIENDDTSAFETIDVAITGENQIILNGTAVSQDEFRRDLSNLIRKTEANHQIKFQVGKGTSYDFYRTVQDQMILVYTDLRNNLAKKKFGKLYKELGENEQKEITEIYPTRIKE